MKTAFSDAQISRIIDQALLYQCACPAQVATTLLELRDLFDYQARCRDLTDTDRRVHEASAKTTAESHALMEKCLEHVMELEGWDRETLTMPAELKQRATKSF